MRREYTLEEIDAMRAFVEAEVPWSENARTYASGGSSAMQANLVYENARAIRAGEVENRLRTYIAAGLGPNDLKR